MSGAVLNQLGDDNDDDDDVEGRVSKNRARVYALIDDRESREFFFCFDKGTFPK